MMSRGTVPRPQKWSMPGLRRGLIDRGRGATSPKLFPSTFMTPKVEQPERAFTLVRWPAWWIFLSAATAASRSEPKPSGSIRAYPISWGWLFFVLVYRGHCLSLKVDQHEVRIDVEGRPTAPATILIQGEAHLLQPGSRIVQTLK
jgi:hypothetical protein